VPREQALRVLERLAEAPWHLVSRIDSGEFCLRYRAHDALDQIGAYAASLRVRLPERQRDRVRGLPDDFDPIDAADVPTSVRGVHHHDRRAAPQRPDRRRRRRLRRRSAALRGSSGLGPGEESDADEVDVSLVAVKRTRRRG
jgi:hypothetical protein